MEYSLQSLPPAAPTAEPMLSNKLSSPPKASPTQSATSADSVVVGKEAAGEHSGGGAKVGPSKTPANGPQKKPSKAAGAVAGAGASYQLAQCLLPPPPSAASVAQCHVDAAALALARPQHCAEIAAGKNDKKKEKGAALTQKPKKIAQVAARAAPASAAPQPVAPFALAVGQPCRIFADVSNIWTGIARSHVPLRVFLARVYGFCRLDARIAFGSKTPECAAADCDWEKAFREEGWQLRCELRPQDGEESMVDDSIAAHVYRAIIDNRGESIVVLSGDGNQRNHSQVSIFDAILSAMKHKIRVVVWCWRQGGNGQYQRLAIEYPSLLSLNFLDEIVPKTLPAHSSPPTTPLAPLVPVHPHAKTKIDAADAAGDKLPKPIPPKMTSFTITLQSAANAVVPACSAPVVLQCVRDDLKHLPAALEGLLSTSESFGRGKTDFIFVNFSRVQSAEAALQHYKTSKELKLQGGAYAVRAAWKRECKAFLDSMAAKALRPLPDINKLFGLGCDLPLQDDSEWLKNLLDQPGGAQPVPPAATAYGSILSLYCVEAGGAATASLPTTPPSSDSDSDASIDFGATVEVSQPSDFLGFNDECAQEHTGTDATPVDPQSLLALPSLRSGSRAAASPSDLQPSPHSKCLEESDSSAFLAQLFTAASAHIDTGSGSGSAKTSISAASLLPPMDSEGA